MQRSAIARLRELNGFGVEVDVNELRRRAQYAEAEADKWRRLHQGAVKALIACSAMLALALLVIAILAATRGAA